jgi:hypothetical protein
MVPAVTDVCLPQRTLPGPCLGAQLPSLALTAGETDKARRPARCEQIFDTGRFIGEPALELNQRAGKVEHGELLTGQARLLFQHPLDLAATTFCVSPDAKG